MPLRKPLVGSPQQIADELVSWIDEAGVDGFNLTRTVMPESFEDFVNLAVPESQNRGVYKEDYDPAPTLREKLFGGGRARLPAVHAGAQHRRRAAYALDDAWRQGPSLSAETRARVALATSEAKIVAHRAALDVSEKLFDAYGARATHAPLALDRFWRNARVHTLHDPIDYRVRDVGR